MRICTLVRSRTQCSIDAQGSEGSRTSPICSVASLVLEDGGDEDEAIGALFHDAAEDAGRAMFVEETPFDMETA